MKNLKEKLVSEFQSFINSEKKQNILTENREQAFQLFKEKGFPTVKNEEWKYTNLKTILHDDLSTSIKSENIKSDLEKAIEKYSLNIDSYKLVFVNGIFNKTLSETLNSDTIICALSDAIADDNLKNILSENINKIAKTDLEMVGLNIAFAQDGAFTYIPKNKVIDKSIEVLYFTTDTVHRFSNPRNLFILEDNAQVKIVEKHISIDGKENVTNSLTEVAIGKNTHFDLYKIQNDAEETSIIDSTFITQERDSVASVHTVSLGGKFIRNELSFIQNGENCNSILQGISIGENKQLIDHHTMVEHVSPNCESHELYRTILNGESKGVFNGKVLVDSEAQKIDAFQQNNNILLSKDASVKTKPQLEIFADDVKCSHGCTVGQLDHDAMFYLMARGIPEKEAKGLLLFAFSSDVLEGFAIPELKEKTTKAIAKKLGVGN